MSTTPSSHRRQRVCPWCSRSFTKDEHLARHARTHTREKPFSCTVCQKTFSRHDSLLRHARRHPPNATSAQATELGIGLLDAPSTNQTSAFNVEVAQRSVGALPPAEQPPTHAALSLPQLPVHDGGARAGSSAANEFARPGPGSWFPTETHSVRGPASAGIATDHYQTFGLEMSSHVPEWFAGSDFDLDAINTAIMSAAYFYPQPGLQPAHEEPVCDNPRPSDDHRPPPVEDAIRQNWVTFIHDLDSSSVTPDTAQGQSLVDEAYREHLAAKLQLSTPTLPLPSTDFLNLCVQMYFTRFHPVYPILHAPTFRPSANRSLLLLSICSIGSLFLSSPHAAAQGVKIFGTLNKSILSCWEHNISVGGYEAVTMIQAALLGQTFGILSRRKKDLLVAQTFHGTLIAWARRFNMFQAGCASNHLDPGLVASDPDKAWKAWVHAEERNRIAAGIYIHDIELAELSLSEPFLGNGLSRLPPVTDEALWSAPTGHSWAMALAETLPNTNASRQRSPLHAAAHISNYSPNRGLYAYLQLERIAGNIIQDRTSGSLTHEHQQQHTNSLVHFYNSYISNNHRNTATTTTDPHLLPVLWHSLFISLSADLNRLELAIGKQGHDEAQRQTDYARRWACSQAGFRSALHAVIILRELEAKSLAWEPPIYVPRILFRAAIAWFCYTKYQTEPLSITEQPGTRVLSPFTSANLERARELLCRFPEFQILDVAPLQGVLSDVTGQRGFRPNTPDTATFRCFVDVLQRIGHWGISRNYAYILSLLLPEGAGEVGKGDLLVIS